MTRRGQTILEYMLLIGFVVLAIFYMGPALKRGLQSLIKVTADQIGNQADADQTVKRRIDPATGKVTIPEDGLDDAFLVESHSGLKTRGSKLVNERIYETQVEEKEETKSFTNSVTDMGFTKD